ncbi:hypothetical protein [Marinobacterium jannaschii]|uniref:hypothetical protein n=1 Tax=Marinobacterium jannaschii TaxID=64970 RepID=UPI0012EB0C8B|nr:hypothetical protein [Marinobacterium jannaschii]
MNANFTDLDNRLSGVESALGDGWRYKTIDCAADSNALMTALNAGFNNIKISGECTAGDIYMENQQLRLRSSDPSNPGSIKLAANTPSILFIRNGYLRLDDLTLAGAKVGEQEAVVYLDTHSFGRLNNITIDCAGGDNGLFIRASSVRLDNTTIGSNCVNDPVQLADGAYLRVNAGNTITNHGSRVEGAAILAVRNSSVDVRGDNNQIINNSSTEDSYAIALYHNSSMRTRAAGSGKTAAIVKGIIDISASSSASLQAFTWQPDNASNKGLFTQVSSSLHINGLNLSGATIEAIENSTVVIDGGSHTDTKLEFFDGAVGILENGVQFDSTSSVEVGRHSSVSLHDGSDIAGAVSMYTFAGGFMDDSSSVTGTVTCNAKVAEFWDDGEKKDLCPN